MKSVIMRPISYLGRKIHWNTPVAVYRNLNRPDGPWYSILQNKVVVAHSRRVLLRDVKFVVREAGRQKVLETGRKNVHAFAVGYADRSELAFRDDEPIKFLHRAGYLPKLGSFWVDYQGENWLTPFGDADVVRFRLRKAERVLLSEDGLSVSAPEIEDE